MSRPSANVKRLLHNIGVEVFAALSASNAPWQSPILRAITETDVQPWMIFTIIGPLDDADAVADMGQTAQLSAMIFVNATFEISEDDDHYLTTFDARVDIVRAIQRVLQEAPPNLLTIWRGEEESEIHGAVLSQSKILISWNEPT